MKITKIETFDEDYQYGTNPCSEIILRPNQFCNLTEVVVRAEDTLETLTSKVEIAAILGTVQSTLTHFPYLRKIWKTNTEEERLLGVSLTGIVDNINMTSINEDLSGWLEHLKSVAIEANRKYAEDLGINPSTAITCVKPSGTVSQLVDSASGIHPRHSQFYVRTVRGDNKDPLTQFMKDMNIPNEPDVTKPASTTVFSFPMKAPSGAILRRDLSALDHLKLWMVYQEHWCEHKPSITISVKEEEWLEVGAFVYKHFDKISGVSFLPYSDHTYQQAPYQEVGKEEYETLKGLMPLGINWEILSDYENEDNTAGSQSYACSGDFCEVVDLT